MKLNEVNVAITAMNEGMNNPYINGKSLEKAMLSSYDAYVSSEKAAFIGEQVDSMGADKLYLSAYMGVMTYTVPALVLDDDNTYKLMNDDDHKRTLAISHSDVVTYFKQFGKTVAVSAQLDTIAEHIAALKVSATYGRDDVNGSFPECTIGSVQREIDSLFSDFSVKFDRKDIRTMITACSISILTDRKGELGHKLNNRANIRAAMIKIVAAKVERVKYVDEQKAKEAEKAAKAAAKEAEKAAKAAAKEAKAEEKSA